MRAGGTWGISWGRLLRRGTVLWLCRLLIKTSLGVKSNLWVSSNVLSPPHSQFMLHSGLPQSQSHRKIRLGRSCGDHREWLGLERDLKDHLV